MRNSHIDEIVRGNFGHAELPEGTKDEMWDNIVTTIQRQYTGKLVDSHRRGTAFWKRTIAIVSSVAVVAISGILVYRTVIVPSASPKSGTPQLKSTKKHVPLNAIDEYYKEHPPVTVAEKYYKDTLGFQPMLPSYIPRGLKTADSTITTTKDVHGSKGSFSLVLCNKNLSGQKTFLSDNKISISEEPLTQYNQQRSGITLKHSTIKRDGLTITLYQRQLNTMVEMARGGISYNVFAMTKDYTTDDLIKVLESIKVPEENKPIITQISVGDSLQDALKTIHFKATIPNFVPEGFTVQRSWGTTDLRGGSFNSLMSEFQILYVKGTTSILVDEIYESGGIFLPPSKMTSINGHKVHVNGTGLGYSWKDPKTGVVYNVNVGNSSNQSAIDRPTLEKLVASMMG